MNVFSTILNWSEIWALLIPFLVMIFFYKTTSRDFRPLFLYVCIALVLNSFSTISFLYHAYMPEWLKNNNIYYNLHSIVRVVFFSWYLNRVTPGKNRLIRQLMLIGYGIFVVVHFSFFNSIFFFSTWLFAAESIILLTFCINFYLKMIQDDSRTEWTREPFFLICTAMILYEAITFFIFLFLLPMAKMNPEFGLLCLKIYKITFIVLNISIAVAVIKTDHKNSNRRSKTAPA